MNRIAICMLLTSSIAFAACGAPASENTEEQNATDYSVHYTIGATPSEQTIWVEMVVKQSNGQLIEFSFENTNDRVQGLKSDGELNVTGNSVSWLPASRGGKLSWYISPSVQRNGKGYDALMRSDWAVLRAEDLIPRARSRTKVGTASETTMSFDLPNGWSSVSEYASIDGAVAINNPERRFDQPVGWIAIGKLGVRRESIAGTQVTVAAPRGENVRRLDMLALLNWTLPALADVLDAQLPRLTIISAGDPMWRGGLSAPGSMFIHADRPLISENGTSTLLHELVHVAFNISAESGNDWIVEGLAEYYSLELLRRGSAITKRRYQRSIQKQKEWANDASRLCGEPSTGAVTARAVTVFHQLNVEIQTSTDNSASLDDIVRQLSGSRVKVSLASLRQAAQALLGDNAAALEDGELPGCTS